jgi:hypothetical protein
MGGEYREVKNTYGYLILVAKTEGKSSLDRSTESLRDNIIVKWLILCKVFSV